MTDAKTDAVTDGRSRPEAPWPARLVGRWRHRPPVVSVLRLSGAIGEGGRFSRGLSLAGLAAPIHRAFADRRTQAVALAINSPGGSPVQSALIAGRIRELAAEHDKPVIAFIEDVGASGGYWLALAGDEIYADASSIVGSIGVVFAGFGFSEAIARLGIERRVHTAGTRKVILDPFAPERSDDVDKLKSLQADIHDGFKSEVRARRGDRLKLSDDELFDGDVWTGARAAELGLIDGVGHMRPILRQRFGNDVRLRLVGGRRGWLSRQFRLDRDAGNGGQIVDDVLAAVEARALWARFGL